MPEYTFIVDEQDHDLRLDVMVARCYPSGASRTTVKKWIDAGCVLVDGRRRKGHYRVAAGEQITVAAEEVPEGRAFQPEAIPLDIMYEDESLLVLLKPARMLVHPTPTVSSGTLVNALLHHCESLSEPEATGHRPGIVHRLDRETSGVMVVAKDNVTHARLARQFERHQVRKRYLALVRGWLEFDEGMIDAPLGKHPRHFGKKAVSYTQVSKDAVTVYRVLKRLETQATLVALYPQSGRTHQLRVHMAYLGHPILGDDKYGDPKSLSRLGLHAQALGFRHPRTGHFVEFTSPWPQVFRDAV